MQIHIDISVFSPTASLGVIHGEVDISEIPSKGGEFSFPKTSLRENSQDDWFLIPKSFRVDEVIRNEEHSNILVMLDDWVLESKEQFIKVSSYLEKVYGLYADEHS